MDYTFTFEELADKRVAYFVMRSQYDKKRGYLALVAIEGVPGYHPMSGNPEKLQDGWYWGHDYKIAEQCADKKNEMMGISKLEATKIVLSTMRESKLGEDAELS